VPTGSLKTIEPAVSPKLDASFILSIALAIAAFSSEMALFCIASSSLIRAFANWLISRIQSSDSCLSAFVT
jgi:hypothetical protein